MFAITQYSKPSSQPFQEMRGSEFDITVKDSKIYRKPYCTGIPRLKVCFVRKNLSLIPSLSLQDRVSKQIEIAEKERGEVKEELGVNTEMYEWATSEVHYYKNVLSTLKSKDKDVEAPHKDFIAYGKSLGEWLQRYGLITHKVYLSDPRMNVSLQAEMSPEVVALKNVYIIMDILSRRDVSYNDSGISDMIRYIIYPILKAQLEVEIMTISKLYVDYETIYEYKKLMYETYNIKFLMENNIANKKRTNKLQTRKQSRINRYL